MLAAVCEGYPTLAEPGGYEMKSFPENLCSQCTPMLILSDGEQIPSGSASKTHCIQVKYLTAFVFMI